MPFRVLFLGSALGHRIRHDEVAAVHLLSRGSVSDYVTLPWNAKAQPSLASDSASFGLASAKTAKKSWLTYLAMDRRVSASTQNQALSALLFLYRQVLRLEPGAIDHVPHHTARCACRSSLADDEVCAVLDQLSGIPRIVAALLYASRFLRPSIENIEMRQPTGPGNSCSPQRGFVETRDSDHRPGIICTNPSSSAHRGPSFWEMENGG